MVGRWALPGTDSEMEIYELETSSRTTPGREGEVAALRLKVEASAKPRRVLKQGWLFRGKAPAVP